MSSSWHGTSFPFRVTKALAVVPSMLITTGTARRAVCAVLVTLTVSVVSAAIALTAANEASMVSSFLILLLCLIVCWVCCYGV